MFQRWPFKSKHISIEKAGQADLQQCADIHAVSFSSAWGDGELASLLQQGSTCCLVAKTSSSDHSVIGFLMYRNGGGEAEILTIAVHPNKRKAGTGALLLEEMIRQCRCDRMADIFLEVEESNKGALQLYKKSGFKKVGVRKGYYAGPANATDTRHKNIATRASNAARDALIMRLDLTH